MTSVLWLCHALALSFLAAQGSSSSSGPLALSVSRAGEHDAMGGVAQQGQRGQDVSYTWGDKTALKNGVGRITRVDDEAGSEEREYGELGELTRQVRRIQGDRI